MAVRELSAAEEHIDVRGIDRLLNDTKDRLDEAIQVEQRRVIEALLDGRRARLRVTPRMRHLLEQLHDAGVEHARQELVSMGYPVSYAVAPERVTPLLDRLKAMLGLVTIRVRKEAVDVGLSSASRAAIIRALMRTPGARDAASRVVSGAFTSGLAETFESAQDLVDRWQISSVLDGATCDECEARDGDEFDTWDEAVEVMPDGGPLPECLGGERCRCRLAAVPP